MHWMQSSSEAGLGRFAPMGGMPPVGVRGAAAEEDEAAAEDAAAAFRHLFNKACNAENRC